MLMMMLGLGLGMVMQVLVLAVQNAVDYAHLGVATSGSILFRSIGGSVGVSLFGAIFANRLQSELAPLAAGGHAVVALNPASVGRLSPAAHAEYVQAFAAALHPVFIVAAVLGLLAFLLSWVLREMPLRKTVEAAGIGESFAMPRNADSLRELERIVVTLARRENRGRVYVRIAERAGVYLAPAQSWLLMRLSERAPMPLKALAGDLRVDSARLAAPLDDLRRRSLVGAAVNKPITLTGRGRKTVDRLIAARREGLTELLAGWSPEHHAEVMALLDRLARTLTSEMPTGAAGVRTRRDFGL
jgi:DNA-binding MarR family transcriptional regulator